MFTIKFYSLCGGRQIIKEAESFTILRGDYGEAEITLHQKNSENDMRIDIKHDDEGVQEGVYSPRRFGRAIIENSAGKTTEIIQLLPAPGNSQSKAA